MMIAADKTYRYLNLFMAKDDLDIRNLSEYLSPTGNPKAYMLDNKFELDGILYVKNSAEKRPRWSELVDSITGVKVVEAVNRSSSAVLLLRQSNRVFAFTFGYGRYLIDTSLFVQDFGIKTALNTLDHQSLRSVDLHTLEDQPVQKKSQAARTSDASIFGIDISRDILRAVTGTPKAGIELKNISGGDAMFSFGTNLDISEFPRLADQIATYYALDDYKKEFSWVDNVRRVKEKGDIDDLDAILLDTIKNNAPSLIITLPEIGRWDSIVGFSFTRTKREIMPTIEASAYFSNINKNTLSIEAIKRDRLFVFDVNGDITEHSIYKCLYLEIKGENKTHTLFGGVWYEIENSFMKRIDSTLGLVRLSTISFPGIEYWNEGGEEKIESEGSYNSRAAVQCGFHLLDRKLVKSSKTTTSIELCDLLSPQKQFIHVKHRKGGSAGLSHLFAQGGVSAEIFLGDKEFRKEARKVIKKEIGAHAVNLVPLDSPKSSDYEVVYLILGDDNALVKDRLPFFSKVNLTRAYEGLAQRGFTVSIAAAPKIER